MAVIVKVNKLRYSFSTVPYVVVSSFFRRNKMTWSGLPKIYSPLIFRNIQNCALPETPVGTVPPPLPPVSTQQVVRPQLSTDTSVPTDSKISRILELFE